MIVTALIFIQVVVFCLGNDGYITVLNLSPQNSGNTRYQCYIPSTFTSYNLSYGRSFGVANGESFEETSWDVPNDIQHGRYVAGNGVGMGIYYCKIVKDGATTVVQTSKIRENAVITPADSKNTVTVNVGDDVTIRFNTYLNSDLVWRKNGSTELKNGTEKSMTFNPVETSDAGVYEMYQDDNRNDRRHAFIKLIVRECPRHKWGPLDCTGDCEYCYNGGVCDDKTGFCICPPGFKGATCETECGANRHGWNCENRCVTFNNPAHACSNKQFCLPDPYGCTCVSGFKGIPCQTECSPGTFGADCAQTCHCKRECCDRYTGRCTSIEDSSCAFPWAGSNCQKCQPQLYGENCDMECKACNECHRLTGRCITCATNYLEPDCEIGIINTTFTPANNGQNTTATCKVYQTGAYEVQTMVIMMNNDVTGNITTALEAKQDGQNIMIYTFSVIADVDSTYKCVISHEDVLAQSVIIPEIFRLPFYTGSLAILNITSSSIAIEWTAWKIIDDGDGPVVGYFLYHKLSNTDDWKKILYLNDTSGTVTGLIWDTEYSFAVSAVRPGEGGKGPIGEKELRTKTLCGIPLPIQTVEHQLLTNGNVKVSWRRNPDVVSLKCFSNTLMYNIYLKVINNEGYREDVYHTNTNQLTINNIGVADSYVIYVTISNTDSESISVGSSIEQENESPNSSISVAIIGGAVAAGVFIGIVFTIMIIQCKQRLRKNVSKHDNHESNGQNVYKNYATSDEHVYQDFESNEKVYQNSATTNESVSRAKLHKNADKSADEMSVELHVYQNYEIKDNDSGNPSCFENDENVDDPRNHSYESIVLN